MPVLLMAFWARRSERWPSAAASRSVKPSRDATSNVFDVNCWPDALPASDGRGAGTFMVCITVIRKRRRRFVYKDVQAQD